MTGNVTAGWFAGSGNTLSNLNASNIAFGSLSVNNIYSANSITTSNIISDGFTSNGTSFVANFDTLSIPFINTSTLNVSYIANLINLIATSHITADCFVGDGNTLSNINSSNIAFGALSAARLQNNQTNITSVGTLTTLSVTGNVTAGWFVGGGNTLSNLNASNVVIGALAATYLQNNQTNITTVGTLSTLSVTGNVTAGWFVGGGNTLSNLNASNVAIGALSAARLQNNQTNITTVGTLTTLSVTGNVTAGWFVGDGNTLSNLNASNVAIGALAATYLQNNQTNITTVGTLSTLSVTGNVTAGWHVGGGNTLSNLNASNVILGALATTYLQNNQTNITSVGTLSTLSVTGNVTAGWFAGSGNTLSNINASNVAFGALSAARLQNNQSNITSVGTLTSLTVTNNATAGWFIGGGNTISNIQGANVIGAIYVTQVVGGGNAISNINASNIAFGNLNGSWVLGNTLSNINASNISGDLTVSNLTVSDNIISPSLTGNTYLSGNLVISGNVYSSLGFPLGEGGGYFLSLPSQYAIPVPYTGVNYGTTYPFTVGLSNGFTITGTSTLITVTTNGTFKFNKQGVYKLTAVLNGSDNITGLALGSNVADGHGTDQNYVYRHTPFITQNPSELIEIPINVTDETLYYYLDIFMIPGLTPHLHATSNTVGGTYLTITPLQGGGLASGGPGGTPGTQWVSSGSDIYFPNSVGIGAINPAYNLDVSTGTAGVQRLVTSNISSLGIYGPTLNISSNVIIQSNLAVGGGSVPTNSPPYALYVTGQGYFSNHVTYENFSGFRNRLVNGTFRVTSRANTLTISNTSVFNSNTWVCDRWRADVGNLSTSNVSMTVKQDLPVGTTNGFTNCANVYVARAWGATLDNTWICPLTQTVEASFAFDFKFGTVTAKPTVFTFWANTNVTGDYSVVLRSKIDNTYFANLVTMVSGSNWNRYTVYMPPCLSGTWGTTEQGYMDVCLFGVSYGTGRSNVALTTDWTAGPGYAPMACTGATNWAQTLGAFIQVTGPQLEQGTISTPFEVRPLSDTIRYCKRFYETNPETQYAAALGSGRINSVPYVVTKRNDANVTVYTTQANLSANTNISLFTSITAGGSYANTAITSYTGSQYGFTFNFTQGGGSNKIDEAQFVWQADAEIY